MNAAKKAVFATLRSTLNRVFGEENGDLALKRIRRSSHPRNKSFDSLTDALKKQVSDRNAPMTNKHCPFCDQESEFKIFADIVGEHEHVKTRKVLYQCQGCRYLCTNEARDERNEFFLASPYKSDFSGIRSKREAALIGLALDLQGLGKDAAVLVYGLGHNKTLDLLKQEGYTNAWGSDISEGLEYTDRFINVAEQPTFFDDRGLKFDAIVAVEVWEHFDRLFMNEAFQGLFRMLKPTGIVTGTTGLFSAHMQDARSLDPDEWGEGQLLWWEYPFAVDHTSFYREENLRTVAKRFGMYASFTRYSKEILRIHDPFKRVIMFTPETNTAVVEKLKRDYDGQWKEMVYF